MRVERFSLREGVEAARGVVVVIDVFRSFSTAPVILSLGASRLILENDVERCFALKRRLGEGVRLVGSRDEETIEGFDLTNSPWLALRAGRAFFEGRVVIHRSTSGVSGAAAAVDAAEETLLASFLTASATAARVKALAPELVSLVAMGRKASIPAPEDEACADLIESLLTSGAYDHMAAVASILDHENARKYLRGDNPALPREDPSVCLQQDLFPFALRAVRRGDVVEAEAVAAD